MNILLRSLLGAVLMGSAAAAKDQADFPLRMDIDVSARRNTQNIGAGREGEAKVERVSLRIRVRQASSSPHSDPLQAEIYVIGRQIQTGYFGIIDVVKKDFDFSEERVCEFSTGEYALGRTSGNINVGGTYETFLVVITDADGKILETRSGRSIGDEGIALIREMGPKTLFDRDGNVVGRVKQENSAFKRAVPAATNPER